MLRKLIVCFSLATLAGLIVGCSKSEPDNAATGIQGKDPGAIGKPAAGLPGPQGDKGGPAKPTAGGAMGQITPAGQGADSRVGSKVGGK